MARLTPEQEALLPVVRDEWLAVGLSTEPADRQRAEAGVVAAYRAAGLEPPATVIWLDSPYAGAIAAGAIAAGAIAAGNQQVAKQVWEVWWQVRRQVVERVREQVRVVGEHVGSQVWEQVRDQVYDQIGSQVREQGFQAWNQVRDQVAKQVWDQAQVQAWEQVWASWDQVGTAIYGQHDAEWLGCYDYFGRVGCDVSRLHGLMEVARSAGWWWPFLGAVILTDRPAVLRRDEQGRLHCDDGPALLYRDGWGVWAIHGVRVPRHVVERPETITADEIRAERNAEIRRVMLDRYGWDRYLLESDAELLDEVTDDQVEIGVGADGLPAPVGLRGARLYRLPIPDDEDLVMVSLLNSTPEPDGTRKPYLLRVPPTMRTVREAVAWTFGLEAHEYAPVLES